MSGRFHVEILPSSTVRAAAAPAAPLMKKDSERIVCYIYHCWHYSKVTKTQKVKPMVSTISLPGWEKGDAISQQRGEAGAPFVHAKLQLAICQRANASHCRPNFHL